MVRRFDPARSVTADVLGRILELAVRAPSAGFSQGWDFVVVRSQDDREAYWAATTDTDTPADAWLRGVCAAPVLILCCSDKERYLDRYTEPDKPWPDRSDTHWPVPYWDVDTGMAAMLMLLGAVDEGLGGLFFGVPEERVTAVHELFGVPATHHLVGVVAVG